jgi:hypothetical protein
MQNMSDLRERPIFIVGHPRSGTTLLRFILSSHPRIDIPGETGFIPFLHREVGVRLDLDEVEAMLEKIGRMNRDWDRMVPDPRAFYHALPAPSLAHVLDALYRRKIASSGAGRWGDKTPSYVRSIATLERIFPRAQFLHVIRDGRDTALSARRKWGRRRPHQDLYYLLRMWVRDVHHGQSTGRRLGPDRYLEVRYEQLVGEPQRTVERVCDFLREGYHPSMGDHTTLARERIQAGGHEEVWEPITPHSVQRWRDQMSTFDLKMADRVAGPTLARLGYPTPHLPPFTPLETLKLAPLQIKFALVDGLRRALLQMGWWRPNRGKRKR